ncbi:MAG: DUF29 domain-containing protein [Jaaginema sp. PMC 1079.18]|nr:DUF29 domain-containing protein [Jaaginema sp. PMC 1080.18]MEC4849793.1 DUF29 domain-containing protein [Jaaginema sp. PMC 1079.18]MEC4866875.1 DUF29 domain-containing protein [Jaaginema sp. PMC 1078.18]
MAEAQPPTAIPSSRLYETDFQAWIQKQALLLQQRQWHQLDVPHLIEEIESLGKQQRQELRNRLAILLGHLLKWEYQPQNRSRSWLATIRIQRLDIAELLTESPSLQSYQAEALRKGYTKGVLLAVSETQLPLRTFPAECPYSWSEILADYFYPGELSDLLIEWE